MSAKRFVVGIVALAAAAVPATSVAQPADAGARHCVSKSDADRLRLGWSPKRVHRSLHARPFAAFSLKAGPKIYWVEYFWGCGPKELSVSFSAGTHKHLMSKARRDTAPNP